jgi:DNA-binding MarR family transcriptional regulator
MTKKKLTDVAFKLMIDLGIQLEGSHELRDLNVPQLHMRILRFVLDNEDVTPLAIATAIRRDKGHMTRLLRELVADGFIVLRPNPMDGRSKIVTLTPKARGIFEKIHAAEVPIFGRAVEGIPDRDLDTFFTVAEKISRNLSQS